MIRKDFMKLKNQSAFCSDKFRNLLTFISTPDHKGAPGYLGGVEFPQFTLQFQMTTGIWDNRKLKAIIYDR